MYEVLKEPGFFKSPNNWERWKASFLDEPVVIDGLCFNELDLTGIDFSGVRFQNCTFEGCVLKSSRFISASLIECTFIDCELQQAQLIACELTSTRFESCGVSTANFLTAVLSKVQFIDCDLRKLDLQSMDVRDAVFDGSDLREQNLSGKDFSNSSLCAVDLSNADLRNARFDKADLSAAILLGVKLKGASFRQSILNSALLSGLDLSEVNFSNAEMQRVDLRESRLCKAELCNADISGAMLYGIDTDDWNIKNVKCSHALWDKAAEIETRYKRHEFERIYSKALTIELKYDFRLTSFEMSTLPILIDHLQAQHWGVSLRLKSVSDIAGGASVVLEVEDCGSYAPEHLEKALKQEAQRLQNAQLAIRVDHRMQSALKEAFGQIKESFWPRLLELAAEHELDQIKNFCVLFIDLKGFSEWQSDEATEKLSLFRGLLKPILAKWKADYPNMEGDSLRATFRLVEQALDCAWMIQDVLTAAGFEVRIGIDRGQISIVHNEVTEQSDIEGHAVNMAARLESMANPGQIYVSERIKVHAEQVGTKYEFIPIEAELPKGIGSHKAGELISLFQLTRKD